MAWIQILKFIMTITIKEKGHTWLTSWHDMTSLAKFVESNKGRSWACCVKNQSKITCITVKPFFFSRESIFRGRPPYKIPRGPMFARFFHYNCTIWQFFADFQKIAKSAKNRPPRKRVVLQYSTFGHTKSRYKIGTVHWIE